jgi:hypothetical protein
MTPVHHVAVINRSSLPDARVALIIEAHRDEVARVARAWGLPVPGIAFYGDGHNQKIEAEALLIFTDSLNIPDAFGIHTAFGIAVVGYIDVALCELYGEPPDRVFSHELFELVGNPGCDEWAGPYPDGTRVAKELCDMCQRNSRTKHVKDDLYGEGDVEISDFALPSWFTENSEGPWTDQESVDGPLKVADGGYVIKERNGVVLADGAPVVKSFGRTFRRLTKQQGAQPMEEMT